MLRKMFFVLLVPLVLSAQDDAYRPGDHDLLIMPTAYTMEKGNWYFSNYEILFLNLTYAPTGRTHFGIFTLFPITTDFLESVSLGIKQNYLRTPDISSAVWGSYSPKGEFYILGNAMSFGSRPHTFHLNLMYINDTEGYSDFDVPLVFALGYAGDTSKRFTFLFEYYNVFENFAFDQSLIVLGFRLRSGDISWELGGFRPLTDAGDLILFPILKATIYFN